MTMSIRAAEAPRWKYPRKRPMSKQAQLARLPSGPVAKPRGLLGRCVSTTRYVSPLLLVRYRGMLMCVSTASKAVGIDIQTVRIYAESGTDIDDKVDARIAFVMAAQDAKRVAAELGMTAKCLVRRRKMGVSDTTPARSYRKGGFAARARELAKDSPFNENTIRERLRRGWPDDLAKSAPMHCHAMGPQRPTKKALAKELAKDCHPSLGWPTILCRLARGWSADEARWIARGMR